MELARLLAVDRASRVHRDALAVQDQRALRSENALLRTVAAAQDRAGADAADRSLAKAAGQAEHILDIAGRRGVLVLAVDAAPFESSDEIQVVDRVADVHDQIAATALLTRRAPVVR